MQKPNNLDDEGHKEIISEIKRCTNERNLLDNEETTNIITNAANLFKQVPVIVEMLLETFLIIKVSVH